jgi:hypothetical protein
VRLVEDDRVVLRKHAHPVAPLTETEVGEVERVVRDHEVGVRRPLPRLLREAEADERTRPPETAVGTDRELCPQRLRGLELELRPIAGLGRLDPLPHRLERDPVLGSREERAAEKAEPLEPVSAQVVLPPLQNGDSDVVSERRGGERDVLRQELLLERLRRGRDDEAEPRVERRDEVGEALARPRARLREQVRSPAERSLDGRGQLALLLARLVSVKDAREATGRSEHVFHKPSLRFDAAGERRLSQRAASRSSAA